MDTCRGIRRPTCMCAGTAERAESRSETVPPVRRRASRLPAAVATQALGRAGGLALQHTSIVSSASGAEGRRTAYAPRGCRQAGPRTGRKASVSDCAGGARTGPSIGDLNRSSFSDCLCCPTCRGEQQRAPMLKAPGMIGCADLHRRQIEHHYFHTGIADRRDRSDCARWVHALRRARLRKAIGIGRSTPSRLAHRASMQSRHLKRRFRSSRERGSRYFLSVALRRSNLPQPMASAIWTED